MNKRVKVKVWIILVILTLALLVPIHLALADSDYSTIRVKISISKPSVTINLDGEYILSEKTDLNLSRGTYTLSIENDKIKLKGNGIDTVVGPSITFIRQSYKGSGNNHLTVSGTDYGNINYLGDMKFTVNSGKILVVNHVPLEEYLYGVVAYEMSDSFPLEALKAQAVCARGYAVKTISTSGSYDIGDTPTHQVYKGYKPSYTRVIQAVNETKGQVITYKGNIISTYFAASNGGQTEFPGNTWGGGTAKNKEYPYLTQKDDPYDLENKSSLYQKIFVPKVVEDSEYELVSSIPGEKVVQIANVNENCNVRSGPGTNYDKVGTAYLGELYEWVETVGSWYKIIFDGKEAYLSNTVSQELSNGRYLYENPVLADLQQRAFDSLKASGKNISKYTDVRINNVISLSNGKERWPGTGSRSYVTASASVTVQYYVTGSNTLSNKTDLTLIIDLMKPTSSGGYYLSHDYLNSNLRLRGVSNATDGYYITNGRYGHGVGMSQRGAQTMAANHSMTYDQILAFYYDGTTLSNLDTSVPTLPDRGTAPSLTTSTYTINNQEIMGLSTNLQVNTFHSNMTVKDGSIGFVAVNGEAKTSGVLATGDTLQLKYANSNNIYKNYSIVIYGDINGDGEISLIDILKIQRHLLNTSKLAGPYLTAADVSKDKNVSLLDLLRLQKHLLGTTTIEQ